MPEKRIADEEEEGERGLVGRLGMRVGQGRKGGVPGAEVAAAAATTTATTSTNVNSVAGWVLRERLTRYCDI